MMRLTRNISRHEIRCHCGKCKCQTMDYETIKIVQRTCNYFAKKLGVNKVILRIHSGHRCPAHNKFVGGKPNSQHLMGTAMDFHIDGVSPDEVYNYLDDTYPDRLGLGKYSTFTHIDTGRGKARWQAA